MNDPENPYERPSKSQKKRDMLALQELGAELVALNSTQLAQFDLPEPLADAIAEAQRDSVARQIVIIRSLDGSRYIWPHVLDEVNKALTPYTWLKSLQQTSAVPTVAPEVEAGVAGPGGGKSKAAAQADADEAAAASLTAPCLSAGAASIAGWGKESSSQSAKAWSQSSRPGRLAARRVEAHSSSYSAASSTRRKKSSPTTGCCSTAWPTRSTTSTSRPWW